MTTCKYCPHPGQPHRADHERNWAIWRDYRTTSATLHEVGRAHDILTRERVRQIVAKIDRAIIKALTRMPDSPVPTSEAEREGTLGVEFVFTHEAALDDSAGGWEPLPDATNYDRYARRLYAPRYAVDEGILYRVKKSD